MKKVTAGTFWYWAKHFGWRPPTPPARQELNITAVAEALGADSIEPSGEKLQKIEADQLLDALRAAKKQFRYNIFTQQIEQEDQVLEGIERYYLKLAQMKLKISKEVAIDCVVEVARENEYDPSEVLSRALRQHCRRSRLHRSPCHHLSQAARRASSEATLYDNMIKCTLIAAVRRVYEPGCKHDNACVLMGEQGARKSSFWKHWAGSFSDALRDIQSKDDLMVLHRSWIMEWAELDHITNKRHARQVKAFLSQSTDMFRVPYGKTTEAFPRRGIIVGSTNRTDGFLVDDTGNRMVLGHPRQSHPQETDRCRWAYERSRRDMGLCCLRLSQR